MPIFVTVILSWLVDPGDVKVALNGTLLDEEKVECRPEKVTNAVMWTFIK